MFNEKIILIDKPQGWTSADVVAKIKGACRYNKVGHAGTLDPMATGLLVIGYDEGTKLLGNLALDIKQYQVTIKFGVATDTGDATGKIIDKRFCKLTEKLVKPALASFENEQYYQVPHQYSAVKINGKKAYEYARENIHVDIQPRLVTIYGYKVNDFNPNKQELKMTMNVSKGFYVRSFAIDLAKKLDTVAHITELRRTKCGDYKIKDAYSLKEYIEKYGYKNN